MLQPMHSWCRWAVVFGALVGGALAAAVCGFAFVFGVSMGPVRWAVGGASGAWAGAAIVACWIVFETKKFTPGEKRAAIAALFAVLGATAAAVYAVWKGG